MWDDSHIMATHLACSQILVSTCAPVQIVILKDTHGHSLWWFKCLKMTYHPRTSALLFSHGSGALCARAHPRMDHLRNSGDARSKDPGTDWRDRAHAEGRRAGHWNTQDSSRNRTFQCAEEQILNVLAPETAKQLMEVLETVSKKESSSGLWSRSLTFLQDSRAFGGAVPWNSDDFTRWNDRWGCHSERTQTMSLLRLSCWFHKCRSCRRQLRSHSWMLSRKEMRPQRCKRFTALKPLRVWALHLSIKWHSSVKVHPAGLVKPDDPDAQIKFVVAGRHHGMHRNRSSKELRRRDCVWWERCGRTNLHSVLLWTRQLLTKLPGIASIGAES